MALLTAIQIIDQAMAQAGNTRIQDWCLKRMNTILRKMYREHTWPFLYVYDETLSTTASQAYTAYNGLSNTLWKPRIVQLKVSTSLYSVDPLTGGFPAYIADTSRLSSSGRPSMYVMDRNNSYIYWADSVPSAVETVALLYQKDADDVTLVQTPAIVTHTKNGELWLIKTMVAEIKERMEQYVEAKTIRDTVVKELEANMLYERHDDSDESPREHGNASYV